jgi:RNA polymerase primary sigma factor
MALSDEYQQIIGKLYSSYQSKGFIREDDTLKAFSENNISFRDTDRLVGILLSKGVIFSSDNTLDEDDFPDYGFIDYDKIFSEIIKIDKQLTFIINYIKNIKPPQRHEFNNLYMQAKNGNLFAKNRIIEMHLRQAVRQALFFSKRFSYPLTECIQEAFVGLISGFEKYNINRSQKFQIYVIWHIRQNLYKEILLGNYLINYPYHIKEKLLKIFRIYKNKSESYKHIYRKNIIKKTRKYLSCSKKRAESIYNIFQKNRNIDNLILSDNCISESKIFSSVTNSLLYNYLKIVFSTFPSREHFVIEKRYGIDIKEPLTLDTIGDMLGITRERVRQIEKKAIRRLKHPKRSKNLMKFFDHDVKEPLDVNLPKKEKFIPT